MDYAQLGVVPISDDSPSGEDVKYDDEFIALSEEIAKLTSVTASSEVDYDRVIKLSNSILENKSKNILVASYLSFGLFKLHGIVGLMDGTKIIADLLENFWGTLFPPARRIKGRINAIAWWIERVTKESENMDSLEVEADKKVELLENFNKIDTILNENVEDAPLLYSLIKTIDMKLTSKQKEEQVVESEQNPQEIQNSEVTQNTQEPTQKAPATQQPIKQVQITSDNIDEAFKATVNTLNEITGQMIESKDYRSELFTINRSFAWLDIDSLPPSDKKTTMLNPPDSQEIELLAQLYENKNFEDLLWAAESRVTTYLFWLDLHYYVAESLMSLNHTQTANVILNQVNYFITKLPGLENLTFSDYTPFASKSTKKWLYSNDINSNSSSYESSNSVEEEIECTLSSIDAMNEKMSRSSCVEEEVLNNIKICKCLLKLENRPLMSAYTEKLLNTIEQYSTTKWSPKIATDAYHISIECLQAVDEDLHSEKIASLSIKLALLKPSLIEKLYI
ncbi:MAG: type VI secretion system protein TssA [Campylobacterota bacterium]|nr:type VI secretion system protein TssA [Campylobacterota bacterium]